jgi:sigma-B regulation protein RsbU (phosphoserine phosphatase)
MKPLSECRILIVDDVTANVDVLVGALKGEHKLSVALDGQAALRFVEKTLPDLILLDIMMPGMDGYEVCRRLRAAEATRDIPIMFLSALEDVANKAKGFELGANDYVTKPFEILEVKARVRSLLKAKAYADAVREAMEREMSIAREIQMGILPSDLSHSTKGTGLDIHAVIEPAKHVGGDLFEVMRTDDDHVAVVIGDVMGKGIPAAIFMAVTMTLLRTLARQHREPAEILRRLNDELAAQNPRRMFVTVACLVFELSTGRVTGASAGHNPLLLVRPSGETRAVFRSSGMVAGMMAGRSYTNESLELTRGDLLVLNTDGVTEAENPAEEQYGDDRLLAFVTASAGRTAERTVSALLKEVRGFASGAAQTDDITILAVKYDPDARGLT